MKRQSLLTLAAAGIVTALPAMAQFQKPEDAVKYRQSAMALQGATLGSVFAMANGRMPFDAKVASENIDIIAMLNKLQFRAFVEGSEVGNTRSKPTIWTQKDKFAAEITKNQEAVAKLVAAGKTGNLDQIKAAVGPVGQSCKSCHDEFRKD